MHYEGRAYCLTLMQNPHKSKEMVSWCKSCFLKVCLQISLLKLSKFKGINELLSHSPSKIIRKHGFLIMSGFRLKLM